jgi:hypothetical protein
MTTVVDALPFPEMPPPVAAGRVVPGVVEVGAVEAATAGPPETQVTVAVPDRLSETRFKRATPSLVSASVSTRPRVVKH